MLRFDRFQLCSICLGAMVEITFAVGCSAPAHKFADANPTTRHEPSIAQLVEQRRALEQHAPNHPQYSQAQYGPPTVEEVRVAEPARPTPSIEQTQQLGEVLAELERQGAIDAQTQAQLLDGLKQTDPALWPQLLSYFQAAAARKAPVAEAKPETTVQLASAEQAVPKAEVKAVATPTAPEKRPETESPSVAEEAGAAKPVEASEPADRSAGEQPPPPAGSQKAVEPKRPTEEAPSADMDPTWQQQLQASIARLEKETQHPPSTHDEIGKHAVLRMLYLAAGRREDALRPIDGIPPAHQDFWSKELYGLAALMDHRRNPDTSRRAAEARNHLRGAAARLGELATLQVCNLTCCKEVTSYGVYKPFESREFHPGQELLLYAEIENFKSEHTDQGYHTALKASYQILDERGARVDEKEFALTEEYCQNPRHDFFVRYFIWLPQKIYGGTYTLQLSVEDTLSQKLGQASVEFTIKPH